MKRLVWFERQDSIVAAIQREKSLKKYKREWKVTLIERENPKWADLYPALFTEGALAHLQPPAGRPSPIATTAFDALRPRLVTQSYF